MPHDDLDSDLDDLDPEGPSAEDIARFGGDDEADDLSLRCPGCGASVYHDLAACPRCGADLAAAPPTQSRRTPAWIIPLGAVLALLGMLIWLL